MISKEIITDVRDLILEWLEEYDRTIGWLSKKTKIPYGTLYAILKQKDFSLNQERLTIINKVLGTKFKLA